MKYLVNFQQSQELFSEKANIRSFCILSKELLEWNQIKPENLQRYKEAITCKHNAILLNKFYIHRYNAFKAASAMTEKHLKAAEIMRLYIPVATKMTNHTQQMAYICNNILPQMRIFWNARKMQNTTAKWSRLIQTLEHNASYLKTNPPKHESFQKADQCQNQKLEV